MERRNSELKWLAWAMPAGVALLIAFLPMPEDTRRALLIPTVVLQALLPVITAMTGALSGWPATAALCALAAAAGWRMLPAQGTVLAVCWAAACGLTACLPMKRKLMRPALRAGMCLGAWILALILVLQVSGGDNISWLARTICAAIEKRADSTELLMRAYSAGYIQVDTSRMMLSRLTGMVMITAETRAQMLMSLRVTLEGMLPSLLCGAVVYHTALTTLLSTVLPDWQRRRRGEKGEFPPMEQWFIPRRIGAAIFALGLGWVVALMAQTGVAAFLGRMCANVFQAAFMLQGICWLQWMGKRMGIRSAARNAWSVVLSVIMPLIPMLMGMIDQSRDARHLRPREETDQK